MAAALLALAGCSRPDPGSDGADGDVADGEVVVYDFARDLAAAELGWERSRLRAADPELAARLGTGWGPLETGEEGESFRWTLDRRADLVVFVARPRDVTLVCRCGALDWQDESPQTVSVEVGDFHSPPAAVGAAAAEVAIPAHAWQPGWNRLALVASRRAAPRDVETGSTDTRTLALRVEALEFRGLLDAKPPTTDGATLHLPAGSGVTSYGEAAGQRWALGDFEVAGDVRLGVYLHTRDGRTVLAPGALDVPAGEDLAIELVAEPTEPTEPTEPSWWRGLLAGGGSQDEARVRDAQVVLAVDRMPPATAPADASAPARGAAAGVVVYMIDTLRADRLGAYGSDLGLTPNLDALAREAAVFTEARAQSSWTRPSVVSLFTGLYPQHHGVDERSDGLAASIDTLAEVLWQAGVDTGGIVTNGNVSHQFGLGQGFAEYRHLAETSNRASYHVLADDLNGWGLDWLDRHRSEHPEQPFFLYLHATDPHAPYAPREPFRSRFAPDADPALGSLDAIEKLRDGRSVAGAALELRESLLALYDAEVAWTDAQLGAFFQALRERDLWRETMVVVVADHGEEFLDHGGWEHGRTLYDEQLLVPLLIKAPAGVGGPRRIAGPAGHVDLMPTILDALGVDHDVSRLDGRSLWPALAASSGQSTGALALSHLELADASLRSLVHGRWKLIEDLAHCGRELFDLAADPGELRDLSRLEVLRAGILGQQRRRMEQRLEAGVSDDVPLDDEERKQLEALGYAGD